MNLENVTMVTEFIILGLSSNPKLQIPLFLVFLLIYLITLLGNLVIITLTCSDPHLHTPMYFFLSNLSFNDICLTSVILPKMMRILISGDMTISNASCITQLYFFISSGSIEAFLLTAMAYDRYAAICDPLRYSIIMNRRVCLMLAAASWIIGFLNSVIVTSFVTHLSFCGSNKINQFFCDTMALLHLSCTDTGGIEVLLFIESAGILVPLFLVTLTSYAYIISAILRICSMAGKRKAFSTCSSHLIIVSVYYLSVSSMYMRPTITSSIKQSKILSLFYTTVTPMLNPIIYSLRNKEVKNAFRKVIEK